MPDPKKTTPTVSSTQIEATNIPYSEKLQWDSELRWKWWNEKTSDNKTQYEVFEKTGTDNRPIEKIIQAAIKRCNNRSESTNPEWLTAAVYPTDGELGGLASLVYQEDGGHVLLKDLEHNHDPKALTILQDNKQKSDRFNLKGWNLIGMASHPSSKNGYVGALYWHPDKRHFVLAHRGTDPKNFGSLLTDFKGIFGGSYVKQMNSAATFSHIVFEGLRKWSTENKVPLPFLSFTGHSLGGWLSQVTTFTTKYLDRLESHFTKRKTFPYHPHTVVWDSPGAKPMLLQLKQDFDLRHKRRVISSKLSLGGLDIKSYLSAPNQINTCNSHTGVIYRIFPKISTNTIKYTLATHNLDTLLAAYPKQNDRANKSKLQQVLDWPIRSGITGGKEYNDFFTVVNQLNDYHIDDLKKLKSGKINVEIQQRLNIRYRTKPVDTSKVDMRIFSDEERNFLESMKTLQGWLEKEGKDFSDLKTLNSFLTKTNLNAEDITKIKDAFKDYTLENNDRLLTARAEKTKIEPMVLGIKQIVRRYPEIVEKAEQNIQEIPTLLKAVYQNKSNRLVRKLEEEVTFRCTMNRDRLGLVSFLNHQHKKLLHIHANTPKEAMMYSQIGVDLLKADVSENSSWLSTEDLNGLQAYSGEKGVSFLSISMIRSQKNELQKFKESTAPLLWLDGSSGLKDEDKGWLDDLLQNPSGKKIVLLTKITDQIFEQLKSNLVANDYLSIQPDNLTWSDLTDDSKQNVLDKTVNFQGKSVSLNQLITVDSPAVKDLPIATLLNENTISLDTQLVRLSALEAAYTKLDEEIDAKNLAEVLIQVIDNKENKASLFMIEGFDTDNPIEQFIQALNLSKEEKEKVTKEKEYEKTLFFRENEASFKNLCHEYSEKNIYWISFKDNQFTWNQLYDPNFYKERKIERVAVNDGLKKAITESIKSKNPTKFIVSGGSTKKEIYQFLGLTAEDQKAVGEHQHLFFFENEQDAQAYFNTHQQNIAIKWLKYQSNEKRLVLYNPSAGTSNEFDEISKDKLVVVFDEPGMGKSTTLTLFSDRQFDSSWVLRVNLKDCQEEEWELLQQEPIDANHAAKFLWQAAGGDKRNSLAILLLKHQLETQTTSIPVWLLLDGFDEIKGKKQVDTTKRKEKTTDLLKFLKNTPSEHTKVWVTTRRDPDFDKKKEFGLLFSTELERFDERKQISYLTNFWKKRTRLLFSKAKETDINEKTTRYARALLEKANEFLKKQSGTRDFLGTPLQLRLLAKGFQYKLKDFLNDEKGDIKSYLVAFENIDSLYQPFIRAKYDIYFKEKTGFQSQLTEKDKKILTDGKNKYHQRLALYEIFGEAIFQRGVQVKPPFAQQNDEDQIELDKTEQEELCRIGLIHPNQQGHFEFIHRTFAERFAADYFVNQLIKHKQDKEFQNFLLNIIFLDSKYKVIRAFIDSLLAKKEPTKKALASYGEAIAKDWPTDSLQRKQSNETLFHTTCKEGNGAMIVFLTNALKEQPETLKALALAKDWSGRNALHYAAKSGYYTDGIKHLLNAANQASFIEGEGLIDTFDKEGYTPLHLAAYMGQDAFIRKILPDLEKFKSRKGFTDVLEMGDKEFGYTPLHLAAQQGRTQAVEALLENNVKIEAKSKQKQNTPLHLAAQEGQFEVAEVLLNKGSDVFARNNWATVLHLAVSGNNKDLIILVLDKIKDKSQNHEQLRDAINAKDGKGDTPLMWAIEKEKLEAAELLLKYKVDVNVQNQEGLTALDWAKKVGSKELMQLLRKFSRSQLCPNINLLKQEMSSMPSIDQLAATNNTVHLDPTMNNVLANGIENGGQYRRRNSL